MKVVFISNYFNHHQEFLCLALYKQLKDDFVFVATTPFNQLRSALGYEDMNKKYPFILCYYDKDKSEKTLFELIEQADAVIVGSAPEHLMKKRLDTNKLTLRYTERLLKEKPAWYKYPMIWYHLNRSNPRDKANYLLCASAYAQRDYNRFGVYKNKGFVWGYFPETHHYASVEELFEKKARASILWVGRLIDWKHPDIALEIAHRLKGEGYSFKLNMIGCGDMEQVLRDMIKQYDLESCVDMLGSMPPSEVRRNMEESEIFLFTSDRKEGWGVVLNEAMNSGCAVVANSEIGSAPYLIENEVNGLLYNNGNVEQLYKNVKLLLDSSEKCREYGANAYRTVTETWNAGNAAQRLMVLLENLLEGKETPYTDGPCSKA